MHPRTAFRSLLLLLCAAALSASLSAQTARTITVRMLDGRTGKLIVASNFLVRIDHDQTLHADWMTQNEDGTSKLTLPQKAALLTIQGTFDSSTELYLNCDATGGKDKTADHWYEIAKILATGVATANSCAKPHDAAKLTADAKQRMVAKPGEFVLFVRKRSMMEQAQEDFGDR
ncbi:MAG: hypothetical protein WAN35_19690 [Terracidiphilus sp.]